MNVEEYKNQSTDFVEKKIGNWRMDFINAINRDFAGKDYTDSVIAAAMITSLVDDVQALLQWVEFLAHKVKLLERPNSSSSKTYEYPL